MLTRTAGLDAGGQGIQDDGFGISARQFVEVSQFYSGKRRAQDGQPCLPVGWLGQRECQGDQVLDQ